MQEHDRGHHAEASPPIFHQRSVVDEVTQVPTGIAGRSNIHPLLARSDVFSSHHLSLMDDESHHELRLPSPPYIVHIEPGPQHLRRLVLVAPVRVAFDSFPSVVFGYVAISVRAGLHGVIFPRGGHADVEDVVEPRVSIRQGIHREEILRGWSIGLRRERYSYSGLRWCLREVQPWHDITNDGVLDGDGGRGDDLDIRQILARETGRQGASDEMRGVDSVVAERLEVTVSRRSFERLGVTSGPDEGIAHRNR